jgi:hypothetical protein
MQALLDSGLRARFSYGDTPPGREHSIGTAEPKRALAWLDEHADRRVTLGITIAHPGQPLRAAPPLEDRYGQHARATPEALLRSSWRSPRDDRRGQYVGVRSGAWVYLRDGSSLSPRCRCAHAP